MARVTVEAVDHVARLARLSLTDEERRTFAAQLGEVLGYAETLASLDTSAVEPMSHAGGEAPLRDDVPQAGVDPRAALAAAPDAEGGFFRVPRVIGT
jgi:aspartyl-tRNA(Asn)/glutamyl-tRNA(Gln) amidotransferase subunit C